MGFQIMEFYHCPLSYQIISFLVLWHEAENEKDSFVICKVVAILA